MGASSLVIFCMTGIGDLGDERDASTAQFAEGVARAYDYICTYVHT